MLAHLIVTFDKNVISDESFSLRFAAFLGLNYSSHLFLHLVALDSGHGDAGAPGHQRAALGGHEATLVSSPGGAFLSRLLPADFLWNILTILRGLVITVDFGNCPTFLLRNCFTDFFWDILTLLFRNNVTFLSRDQRTLITGDIFADLTRHIVTELPRHGEALLALRDVALLPGHTLTLLLGDGLTHLSLDQLALPLRDLLAVNDRDVLAAPPGGHHALPHRLYLALLPGHAHTVLRLSPAPQSVAP